MGLLATAVGDESTDGGLIDDSDAISSSQSHKNRSQFLRMTPTPAAPAATVAQESLAALDGPSGIPAATSLMKSNMDDRERLAQVAAADIKQEWEICDILGKEDVNGVPHYWVQWSVRLIPKYDMGKTRALVARFEAGLRARCKEKGKKGARQAASIKSSRRSSSNRPDAGEETAWQTSEAHQACLPALTEYNHN